MEKQVKQLKAEIKEIKKVKEDVFLINFFSPHIAKAASPGSFLHLKINSLSLRRPFSIHKITEESAYILFKVRGRGTKMLSQSKKGDIFDIIGPLGRGFKIRQQTTESAAKRSLPAGDNRQQIQERVNILVAGGIGVAPLVFLAQRLQEKRYTRYDIRDIVLLGAKNRKEILCEKEFGQFGFKAKVATEDGSRGFKGTVVGLLEHTLQTLNPKPDTLIYACGPKEMFSELNKILKKYPKISCQVSFEQFMGCGLGICCGCVIDTKNGYKKVCKDGPVFDIRDIW